MNAIYPLLAPLARRGRHVVAEPGAIEEALRYIAISAFVALIAWVGASLVAATDTSAAITASPAPGHISTTRRPPDAREITKRIAAQHWFGVAEATDLAQSEAPVKEAGPVKVLGIIFANDPQLSRVILAVDDKQKSYSLGARLTNGDKVVSIEADRVTLVDGDKRYALVLKHPGSAMLAKAPHFNGGGAVQVAFAQNPPRSAASKPAPSPSPAPIGSSTTLQRLRALRTRLLSGKQ